MKKTSLIILFVLTTGAFCYSQDDLFEITRLGFNTSMYDESGPKPYKTGMIYTSNRLNLFHQNLKDITTKKPLYNIYFTQKLDSNKWSIPKIFSKCLTTPFSEGYPTFFSNDSVLIFNQNTFADTTVLNTAYFENPVVLISAVKSENCWEKQDILPFVDKKYNYLQPFLYKDSLLFYVSDVPGGYGGTDIYVSVYDDGNWSEPVNLGAEINTSGNEQFPCYHQSNRLFFSSNKNGNYDIYYSDFKDGNWTEAVAFPEPLNTEFNEFCFIPDSSLENGFFSSDREGSEDIFSFRMNWPIFNHCDSLQENNYCFTFFETSNYDLDTMPLRYEWNIAGLAKIRGLTADYCFDGPGMYKIELNIIDTLSGEIFYNQASYNFQIKDIEQVYIDCPDTALVGAEIKFDGTKTNIENFIPDRFYWEFGDGERATGVITKHSFENPGNYTIKLGVKSKPGSVIPQACVIKDIVILETLPEKDTLISDLAENKLSEKTKTVHDTTNISKYNDKGENEIVEDKIYKVEVANSEEQIPLEDEIFNALRDIYTIVENYIANDSSYSYTVGEESNLADIYPIYMKVKGLGYQDVQVKSFNIVPDSITISDTLAKVILNQLLSQWKNIHFDYNSYEILPESYEMLDKVYNVLNKYKSLVIEIAAHTDDLGSDSYNLELSEKRAKAVFNYLVGKGIDPDRLIPKGYGKSKLLNKAGTEKARAENRRVEFIVIKTGEN